MYNIKINLGVDKLEMDNNIELKENVELEEWIEKFCLKNEIKKSAYMKRFIAGEVLNTYIDRKLDKEIIYEVIERKKVSFNAFNLINNAVNEEYEKDRLIEILLRRDITNKDLHYSIKDSKNIKDIIKKLELIINDRLSS